ncbi:DUF1365 domain-containing protein [Simplicispira suum]|uniref:DUF1365 domain-containing protein n=1 Tax=Simplicispira suum TaxID=2109915 RepID=A0A2S0MZP8_9BURK|nr:DUF1365 domain-containing protein [Simplicispira suum]AVO41356.1 DUF1365 domain-containing protein [Simplicispira suum]
MNTAGAARCARPGATGAQARPLIGFGQVRHTRLRPKEHRFSYATFFLLLPMRALARGSDAGALAVNRRGAISFHDVDHGDGRPAKSGGALAWLDQLLRAEGIEDADGEVWLHCYPRVLGYTFKPVSFWYCERLDGSLRAIVVEVNNTFGERHCYLLDEPAWGQELRAEKVFHVSPFCDVSGSYRFRFLFIDKGGALRTVARIDHDDARGALIETSVSGALEPATPAALRRALWRYPVMTFAVIARIHWQALRLWSKRVGFRHKPASPPAPISHQQHPTTPQHREARRQP